MVSRFGRPLLWLPPERWYIYVPRSLRCINKVAAISFRHSPFYVMTSVSSQPERPTPSSSCLPCGSDSQKATNIHLKRRTARSSTKASSPASRPVASLPLTQATSNLSTPTASCTKAESSNNTSLVLKDFEPLEQTPDSLQQRKKRGAGQAKLASQSQTKRAKTASQSQTESHSQPSIPSNEGFQASPATPPTGDLFSDTYNSPRGVQAALQEWARSQKLNLTMSMLNCGDRFLVATVEFSAKRNDENEWRLLIEGSEPRSQPGSSRPSTSYVSQSNDSSPNLPGSPTTSATCSFSSTIEDDIPPSL